MFNQVAQFHRAFGHPVADAPGLPSRELRSLRVGLIEEELEEYCFAHAAQDRVAMADALGDLLVVLAGTAVSYGIAPLDEVIESPYDDTAVPEQVADWSFADLLREDFASYRRAEQADDLDKIQAAIYHMMVEIFGIAWHSDIPINAVFAEICRSNLSKLDADGLPLYRADGKILKSDLYRPPEIAALLSQPRHG